MFIKACQLHAIQFTAVGGYTARNPKVMFSLVHPFQPQPIWVDKVDVSQWNTTAGNRPYLSYNHKARRGFFNFFNHLVWDWLKKLINQTIWNFYFLKDHKNVTNQEKFIPNEHYLNVSLWPVQFKAGNDSRLLKLLSKNGKSSK